MGVDGDYMAWDAADNAPAPLDKAKDPAFVLSEEARQRVGGARTVWELFVERVSKYPPDVAAKITGVPADTIVRIAREFAAARGVIEDGWYTAKNGNDFDTYRLALILNALVGNIDKRGGLCFQESAGFPNVCDFVGPDIVAVRLDELRHVGVPLDEVDVVEALVYNYVGHGHEKCGICAGDYGHPLHRTEGYDRRPGVHHHYFTPPPPLTSRRRPPNVSHSNVEVSPTRTRYDKFS